MPATLWFPTTQVLDLAEKALATGDGHLTVNPATGGTGTAYLTVSLGEGAYLALPATPPPGATDTDPTGDTTHATPHHLRLLATDDAGRTLIDRLRTAAANGMRWTGIDTSGDDPAVRFHTEQRIDAPDDGVQVLVAVDEFLGPYPATLHTAHRGDDEPAPRFSLDVVRRIAADTRRLAGGDGHAVWIIDGQVQQVQLTGGHARHVDTIQPGPDGLYRVRATVGAWSVVETARVDDCHCDTCRCPMTCAVCGEPVDGGHLPRCVWVAGSAPYEQPVIPAQRAVLDPHRHLPGCGLARRRPGPLITRDRTGRPACTYCAADSGLKSHTVRTPRGVQHHQRCAACGQVWLVTAANPHP